MDQNKDQSNAFPNALFQNLSPEKLQFLMNFQNMEKPQETNQAGPFLNKTMEQAKQEGIQFSKDETSMIMELLMQNMPEQERKKAEILMMLLKNRK